MVNSILSLIFSRDSMPIEIKKSLGLGSQLTGTQSQLITSQRPMGFDPVTS
jgi:hypothetical protein